MTTHPDLSDEWILSKRLATEVKLSSKWTGSSESTMGTPRLHISEQVNLRKILLVDHRTSKVFTVSRCGRYLLVRSGHDIFVYRLFGQASISAVVRLAADSVVLKVSMDTSSGRNDVAALLDERRAALWEIDDNVTEISQAEDSSNATQLSISITSRSSSSGDLRVRGRIIAPLPERRREIFARSDIVDHGQTTSQQVAVSSTGQAVEHGSMTPPEAYIGQATLQDNDDTLTNPSRTDAARPILLRAGSDMSVHSVLFGTFAGLSESPEPDELEVKEPTLPIHARPKAVYEDLGTSSDPPRSIAICPQRQCLALGCCTGIELFWKDPLTGSDLNRWFPLAAPSDNLYFLPQRPGYTDTSRKLRLISSSQRTPTPSASARAGSVSDRVLQRQRTHDRNRRLSMTRLFFGNLPFPAASASPDGESTADQRRGVLRTVDCDHYQAVPISDGRHVLYTDHDAGLCLGSDAPVGAPTKLIRKAVFIPPEGIDTHELICYSAASETAWGVRVVAAYGSHVVLYTIPSDAYSKFRRMRGTLDAWDETAGVIAQSDILMDDSLAAAHANSLTNDHLSFQVTEPAAHVALQVSGVHVTHIPDQTIDDLAINADFGSVRVWVFCRNGLAKLFTLYVEPNHLVRSHIVGFEGHLYEDSPRRWTMARHASQDQRHSTDRKQGTPSVDKVDWPSNEHLQITGLDD